MRCLKIAATLVAIAPVAVHAETPRDLLVGAAFGASDKAGALAAINRAIALSDSILAKQPRDHEAQLQRGIGIGYRGKLTRNRTDAMASRRLFETMAAANPRDAEVQLLLAGWHLDAVDDLGGFVARTVVGARGVTGLEALNRAVMLGGNRASFLGLAAMMLIRYDSDAVPQARKWAEAAMAAPAPMPLDRECKEGAQAMLTALRANNGEAAARIAKQMLPFGRIRK